MEAEREGTVEGPNHKSGAIRLPDDFGRMPRSSQKFGNGGAQRLHPFPQLRSRKLDRAEWRLDFKDVLRRRRLEVLLQGFIERFRILLQQALHSIKLIDTPFVRFCCVGVEVCLLPLKNLTKVLHKASSITHDLRFLDTRTLVLSPISSAARQLRIPLS